MESSIILRALSGKFSLIAEIGVNYYDIAEQKRIAPIEAAEFMIDTAATAGIHAVKFQTYKADSLAAKKSPAYWDTSEEPTLSQYELFRKFDSFGECEYMRLAEYCIKKNVEFLSTPFDFCSADYLSPIMGAYKISSSDITNLPFIEHIACKNKPILLSTGASDKTEIDRAVETIRKFNDCPLMLMHCVLEYPTPYANANLRRISALKHEYPNCIIGYSDHTKPDTRYDVLKTAYSLGAIVIEKHFTLDKTLSGNDHYHAMDEADAVNILAEIKLTDSFLGNGELTYNSSEQSARQFARRSIVSAMAIPVGTVITSEHITFKRPGGGIQPFDIDKLIGRQSNAYIDADTQLQWDMFNPLP
ncbi:MAG: N-acetylneuraminate synthase family protein [Fibromonadales bacterium]|nr:N-acetylneuraminate synthase family protein [Fibromonadales bacterium]